MSFKTFLRIDPKAEEIQKEKEAKEMTALSVVLGLPEEDNLEELRNRWNEYTPAKKVEMVIGYLGGLSLESPLKYPAHELNNVMFDYEWLKFEQEAFRVINAHAIFANAELSDKLFDYAKRLALKLTNELSDGSLQLGEVDFFPDWASKANVPIDFVYLTILAHLGGTFGNDIESMHDFVTSLTKNEFLDLEFAEKLCGELEICTTLLELAYGRPIVRPESQRALF